MPSASHNTDAMTFPADGTDLVLFGAEQPASVHVLTAVWILVCNGESKSHP
jgi:hypothetical protein